MTAWVRTASRRTFPDGARAVVERVDGGKGPWRWSLYGAGVGDLPWRVTGPLPWRTDRASSEAAARRAVYHELKLSYYEQGVRNLAAASNPAHGDLFAAVTP